LSHKPELFSFFSSFRAKRGNLLIESIMDDDSKNIQKKITPRAEDYSKWYSDVIDAADIADNSAVRGCMIIKPYGYALWEKIHTIFDEKFKKLGVSNAYFPLLIPQSFLAKEAKHVEGFAKEVAVVTHHRLESDGKGGLKPAGELSDPLIIRPTSETIIYDAFSRWICSYRDLPLLINQWANVLRWEMRTRPFLRTTEFLWQEGHTAHRTSQEAAEFASKIINEYKDFVEQDMALPVIAGYKSESERFAGADQTLCIEAMMQDGKALQAGTSHMLGQNFAKAFNVSFTDEKGKPNFAWQTSWGVSTRLIGALIMAHSDDKGLVLPPKMASISAVVVPVGQGTAEYDNVLKYAKEFAQRLESETGLAVKFDDRELRSGEKYFYWEKRGVPVRIEIGPRDLAKKSVVYVRRDNGQKSFVAEADAAIKLKELLADIQTSLFEKAAKFRKDNLRPVDSWGDFKQTIDAKPGFIKAHWCGGAECEAKIKEETMATIRCIPFDVEAEAGKCVFCGKKSNNRVIFAKAY